MVPVRRLLSKREGQTLAEAVLLAPLFFFFALGLLQACQLGVALVMANYAASSVVRKAAADGITGAGIVSMTAYNQKAQNLMVAGMQFLDVQGCVQADPGMPTASLAVQVRATVSAWPFFSNLIHGALQSNYAGAGTSCGVQGPTFADTQAIGPFNFSANAPYYFTIRAVAKTRLNYQV